MNISIGSHELETSKSIRLGARDKKYARYLAGKVTCIQLYDGELTLNEIFNIAKSKCEMIGECLTICC